MIHALGEFLTALAIGIPVGIVWVLVVLISPMRTCTRCKGTLRAKRHGTWGRVTACSKCKGYGEHYRLGASLVHRWRAYVREEIRERRQERS